MKRAKYGLIRKRKGDPVYQRVGHGDEFNCDVRRYASVLLKNEPHHHWRLGTTDRDQAAVLQAQLVQEFSKRSGGEPIKPGKTTLTVDQWVPMFLEIRSADSPGRDTRQIRTEQRFFRDIAFYRLQNYVLQSGPDRGHRLGDLPLNQLQGQHLDEFLLSLYKTAGPTLLDSVSVTRRGKHVRKNTVKRRAGLTGAAVKHHRTAVKLLLTYAVKRKLIATSPMADLTVKLHTDKREDDPVYHGHELALLLYAADRLHLVPAKGPRSESISTILPTLIYLGLRGRELERLQWRDLLLDAAQPAVHVRGEKSDSADRLIDVPPPLLRVLTRWRDQHTEARPTDLVFGSHRKPGTEMTSWIKPTRRVCQLAEVPYYGPAQCFRRTCITHSALLHNGEQLSEQQLKQFGHADVGVTRAHYIKQLSGSEPPHSRGEYLDFSIEHYLKIARVAERKAAIDAAKCANNSLACRP